MNLNWIIILIFFSWFIRVVTLISGMGKSKKRSKVSKYSYSDSDELDGMKDDELNVS